MDFLHVYLPNSILIDLGFIGIHWYGLLMTLAIVAGFFVARYLFKRYAIVPDHLYNLIFYLIIFGLIGARVYHVLNELPYYLENPEQIVAFWNGGLALHGALIAGILVIYFYLRKHSFIRHPGVSVANDPLRRSFSEASMISLNKIKQIPRDSIAPMITSGLQNDTKKKITRYSLPVTSYFVLTDILAPALVLGQSIGRWGNYFNQELYGVPCDFSWCILIGAENRVAGFESFSFFHPTFLYESLLTLLLFALLMYLHKRRSSQLTNQPINWSTQSPGFITAIYLIVYSSIRILMEFFRVDATPIILGIRLPILVSGLLIMVGIVVILFTFRLAKKVT